MQLVRQYAALNGQIWEEDAVGPVYGLRTEYEGQQWMRRQLADFRARVASLAATSTVVASA